MIVSLLLVLPFLLAAVDEGPVADLVLQAGVVGVAEGGEVVDPGRGRPSRRWSSRVRVLGWR